MIGSTKNITVDIGDLDLELGGKLPGCQIRCTILGPELKENSKVIWICHALTSGSDPSEWWPEIVGSGKPIDTDKFTVICCNVIGSCYGSTGPQSIDPSTSKPYGITFPDITYRDVIQSFIRVRGKLKLDKIDLLIGGSIGGQQALEWAMTEPKVFKGLYLLATNAVHSPWGIAFNESQRLAIEADSEYRDGRQANRGLAAARSIALISYRGYECYNTTQPSRRGGNPGEADKSKLPAVSYQRYQGEKLTKRFDVHSYVTLLNLMDSHDLSRGRINEKNKQIEHCLNGIQQKTWITAIASDKLFPPGEQKFLSDNIPDARLNIIESLYGHDGFLLEKKEISKKIEEIKNELFKEN